MKPIILASQSPRRRALLSQINLTFTVHPSNVSEDTDREFSPSELVEKLARRKAIDVAQNYRSALVIGADTIVVHQGDILGKPGSEYEAIRLLKRLSADTHEVYSGVCLVLTNAQKGLQKTTSFYACTRVTFSSLSDQEIEEYVKTGSPMDKAGAYGIQDDWGSLFVSEIHGDYYNVVGFPLQKFYSVLKDFAPEYLPSAILENG
ncbi:MAG TPA: Maf family protein [Balneolales bacterium]|nr:Maf family protein [Balneolales bacterium]